MDDLQVVTIILIIVILVKFLQQYCSINVDDYNAVSGQIVEDDNSNGVDNDYDVGYSNGINLKYSMIIKEGDDDTIDEDVDKIRMVQYYYNLVYNTTRKEMQIHNRAI